MYNTMHIFEPMDRMIAVIKDVYGEVVQQTLSNCRLCYIIIYGFTPFSFCISIFQTLPTNSYIYICTLSSALKCALKLAAFVFASAVNMWKRSVEVDRPLMTIWRLRSACWITKAIDSY